MNRYSSFRYQVILSVILYHVPILFLTGLMYFLGGLDTDEYIEVQGFLIFIVFCYFLILKFFNSSKQFFLKNPKTFNILWVYEILSLISILIVLKSFFNLINFKQTIFFIKILEISLFFLGNLKNKKTGVPP